MRADALTSSLTSTGALRSLYTRQRIARAIWPRHSSNAGLAKISLGDGGRSHDAAATLTLTPQGLRGLRLRQAVRHTPHRTSCRWDSRAGTGDTAYCALPASGAGSGRIRWRELNTGPRHAATCEAILPRNSLRRQRVHVQRGLLGCHPEVVLADDIVAVEHAPGDVAG